MTAYTYNDGGRRELHDKICADRGFDTFADYKGIARDCVTRSLTIVTGLPYEQIWKRLAEINYFDGKHYSANKGVRTGREEFKLYAAELGLEYVPCGAKFKDISFPTCGRIAIQMKGHLTAMVDGIINDTYNPAAMGRAHVFGYWKFAKDTAYVPALYNVVSTDTGRNFNVAPLSLAAAHTMQTLMFNNYKKNSTLDPYGI